MMFYKKLPSITLSMLPDPLYLTARAASESQMSTSGNEARIDQRRTQQRASGVLPSPATQGSGRSSMVSSHSSGKMRLPIMFPLATDDEIALEASPGLPSPDAMLLSHGSLVPAREGSYGRMIDVKRQDRQRVISFNGVFEQNGELVEVEPTPRSMNPYIDEQDVSNSSEGKPAAMGLESLLIAFLHQLQWAKRAKSPSTVKGGAAVLPEAPGPNHSQPAQGTSSQHGSAYQEATELDATASQHASDDTPTSHQAFPQTSPLQGLALTGSPFRNGLAPTAPPFQPPFANDMPLFQQHAPRQARAHSHQAFGPDMPFSPTESGDLHTRANSQGEFLPSTLPGVERGGSTRIPPYAGPASPSVEVRLSDMQRSLTQMALGLHQHLEESLNNMSQSLHARHDAMLDHFARKHELSLEASANSTQELREKVDALESRILQMTEGNESFKEQMYDKLSSQARAQADFTTATASQHDQSTNAQEALSAKMDAILSKLDTLASRFEDIEARFDCLSNNNNTGAAAPTALSAAPDNREAENRAGHTSGSRSSRQGTVSSTTRPGSNNSARSRRGDTAASASREGTREGPQASPHGQQERPFMSPQAARHAPAGVSAMSNIGSPTHSVAHPVLPVSAAAHAGMPQTLTVVPGLPGNWYQQALHRHPNPAYAHMPPFPHPGVHGHPGHPGHPYVPPEPAPPPPPNYHHRGHN